MVSQSSLNFLHGIVSCHNDFVCHEQRLIPDTIIGLMKRGNSESSAP
jgi:hypothetical protein